MADNKELVLDISPRGFYNAGKKDAGREPSDMPVDKKGGNSMKKLAATLPAFAAVRQRPFPGKEEKSGRAPQNRQRSFPQREKVAVR